MQSKESDINEIMEQIVQFSEDRDWDQFHNGKDLALALSIEASELNEAFLWKSAEDVKIDKIKEELADIINYAFLIAYKYNLDIKDIVLTKLKRNAEKYPIDKAKGCVNPAKRNVMVVKNEMRLLKQKRNVLQI